MAGNGNKKDSPKGYDRWDTFGGTIKQVGKNNPKQQKAIDAINAQRRGKKQPAKKK